MTLLLWRYPEFDRELKVAVQIFLQLFERLIPLYLLVAAGFLLGRRLPIHRESIAYLLIYFITPTAIFMNVSQLEMRPAYLFVPFLIYGICVLLSWTFLKIGGRVFGEESALKNLIAFSAGTANNGYFGLPVAMMVFGPQIAGLVFLFGVGFTVFENTYGFYVLARGNFTRQEAIRRLLRLPTIYAFVAGLLANAAGLKITGSFADFSQYIKGAYSVLGILIVGLGVAEAKGLRTDSRFLAWVFTGKFIAWPLVALGAVALDRMTLNALDVQAQHLLILLGCCPPAANMVAYSQMLKTEPQKAAEAVLLGTFFALVYIPWVVSFF